jgi:hypothetical protein
MDSKQTIDLTFRCDTAQVKQATQETKALSQAVETYAVAAGNGVRSTKQLASAAGEYAVVEEKATSNARMFASQVDVNAVVMKRLTDECVRANVAIAMQGQTAATSIPKTAAQLAAAKKEAGKFGNQLQIVGQGLDDLQYVGEMGLRPVIGNLMQFSAYAGIAAIGINLVWNNWDKISTLWGEGHTKTEAERMEDLAKATEKTAWQAKELGKYQETKKAKEAIYTDKTKDEESTEAKSKAATKEVGGIKAMNDISKALTEIDPRMKGKSEGYQQILAHENLRKAEDLLAKSNSGDSDAFQTIKNTLFTAKSTRDGATYKRFAGYAEGPDKETDEDRDRRIEREEGEKNDKLADPRAAALSKRNGGTYGLTLGIDPHKDIASDLMAAGDSKETAELLAHKVYEKVMDDIKEKINSKALSEGVSPTKARQLLLKEESKRQDAPHLEGEKATREAIARSHAEQAKAELAEQDRKNANAASLRDRTGNAFMAYRQQVTGQANPIQQLMMNARQSGLAGQFKTSGQYRKFMKMGWDEKQEYLAKGNDKVDAQLKKQLANELLFSGATRDKASAAAMADKMVNEQRKGLNSATGDPATDKVIEWQEKTVDEMKLLREQLAKGVKVKVGA